MAIGQMSSARAAALPVTAPNRFGAWLVHIYTSLGTICAFFGTLAVFEGEYRASFLWMVLATAIDSTDGLFARRARVKEMLPGFDGARLDDIIDYLTFVFLPLLLLYHSGCLPSRWAPAVASTVLLSSAYGFGSTDAKTSDHFFTGFPSYWNVAALYLYAAALPPRINAVVLLLLSALVFVRIGYVYPSRLPVLRTTTVTLGLVWGVLVVAIIMTLPDVSGWLLAVSLFYPVYYTVLSLVLQGRRAPALARRL